MTFLTKLTVTVVSGFTLVLFSGLLSVDEASVFSTAAHAGACKTDKVRADITDADINKIYDCLAEKMVAAYTKKGDTVAGEYRNWEAASTQPGIAATHGNRFVHTFVNAIGYDAYVKYSDENPVMPVGTVIAKESFSVGKKKPKVKVGPLFLMTKVEAGTADDFGNWVYRAIAPNGKEMKIKQKFCHGCHQNYDDQDSLGYPGDDYKLGS